MGFSFLLVVLSVGALLRLSSATYAITGVHTGVNAQTGARPFRQNLKDFQTAGPVFDLYIQAFLQFQKNDQANLLSWYEVAGVHGLPYRSWDGANGGYGTGYCEHGSVLFPTWHRPYLALFEQIIWNNAQTIAATYPTSNRATYVNAAKTLRIPFWDWASDPLMPNSVITPTITVTTPTGKQSLRNPLFSYIFHPLPVGTDIPANHPLAKYNHTVRSPDANGISREQRVQQLMSANGAWLRSSTYQLLTTETNYTVFSNEALPDRGDNYNNLESIHDEVHALTGDNGHMTYVDMAAFDPLFFLHHANVDRLFAIWQALNPTSYVQPEPDNGGTFVLRPGTVDNVNTPLYPFHASTNQNDYYTSTSARTLATFGYTYPEIVDWNVSSTQLQKNVRAAVNKLYNPSTTQKREAESPNDKPPVNTTLTGTMSPDQFAHLSVNNLDHQWVINIRCDKHALDGQAYKIHFFYGTPPSGSDYDTAPNLIGTYGTFTGAPMPSGSFLSHTQMPLSPILALALQQGVIPNLTPAVVQPLLLKQLNWVIMDSQGNNITSPGTTEKLQLKVAVVSRSVVPLSGGQQDVFPQYGGWSAHPDVTHGKPGGTYTD